MNNKRGINERYIYYIQDSLRSNEKSVFRELIAFYNDVLFF